MPSSKETLSVFLSISLMITVAGVDGCSKKPEQAQSQAGQPQTAQQQQAPATTYSTPTPDQLYQLVAPIALFPDNLVAQVLAASTFPDQISAAYQWLQQNAALKGQCIIRGRPASEGGSCLCRQLCSVWLHSNQKTERCDWVVGSECWALPGGGGFAPAPPGFIAWMPVPMRGLCQRLMKKGCRSIPLDRSRPLSRRSGCFPASPYPPLSSS